MTKPDADLTSPRARVSLLASHEHLREKRRCLAGVQAIKSRFFSIYLPEIPIQYLYILSYSSITWGVLRCLLGFLALWGQKPCGGNKCIRRYFFRLPFKKKTPDRRLVTGYHCDPSSASLTTLTLSFLKVRSFFSTTRCFLCKQPKVTCNQVFFIYLFIYFYFYDPFINYCVKKLLLEVRKAK